MMIHCEKHRQCIMFLSHIESVGQFAAHKGASKGVSECVTMDRLQQQPVPHRRSRARDHSEGFRTSNSPEHSVGNTV